MNDIDTQLYTQKLTYIVDILTVFHWLLLSPTRGDITYGQGDIPSM